VSAKNSQSNKYFTSVQYSADGEHLLAGGNSKNLCLYELRHKVLLRKFVLTNNRSLDGVLEQLNSKNLKGI
jgi:periodic tryptophan protein 2